GPNGAGKTTTLKMMVGLLRPDRGSVRLFGLPPSDPAARARLGFLPENPYFYDYLTAEEFLDFYGRLKGLGGRDRRERVRTTLARVGMDRERNRPLRKCSKGMIQRLGLAQAVLADPELVILDEPMSGLDPRGRREVRDLILSLRESGRTVFFSSHILQDAELICDRVAILDHGRVRSVGRLDTMISRKVRWFEVTVRGSKTEHLPGEALSSSGDSTLLRVADVEALRLLLSQVAQNGGQVLSVWPSRETLEDLFLREVDGATSAEEPS
ncbi:MAG: ABC transporter ATP-binding protein, partial [Acidobacteriota bacterium]|nr:ABC transporter ATP-binding protein [Acidobacteriota bacterium]